MARKLDHIVRQRIHPYLEAVKKDIPVSAAYVFGSQARGDATAQSDIDIAIISPAFGKDRLQDGFYLQGKLWEVPYKNIDVLGYSPEYFEHEDSPIIHEIKQHGVLIE